MSDTPETKSFYVTAFDVEEWAEKCIRLEKERDEARELLASEKTTRNHIIKRSVEVERERDEARFLLKQAQSSLDAIHLEVGGWIKILKENTD